MKRETCASRTTSVFEALVMGSSTGSSLDIETSATSSSFTFSTTTRPNSLPFMNDDRSGGGSGVPKFKSTPPPSLPISPPSLSPFNSYFSIPPGLSPADLLDSPVLLNTSNVLPSPTTGTFPSQAFDWKNNSFSANNNSTVKQEDKNYSAFSFQTQTRPNHSSSNTTILSAKAQTQQLPWNFQQASYVKQDLGDFSNSNGGGRGGSGSADYQHPQQQQVQSQSNRKSDDGYNWRKYGQKTVKGSENPRSYYKCTYPNCPTKKKVERSLDGQITEIVYKGSHNHPKPQSTRRSSSNSSQISQSQASSSLVIHPTDHTPPDHSHGSTQIDSAATPENSSISIGDDDFEHTSDHNAKSARHGDDYDEEEPEAKRWKNECENEGLSASVGNRTVREPRVVVQTTSDIDILDDGYRWRKYGQKVVKGNPNPRSYYKCTSQGCPVRKHVERASHDMRAVITTYEGKHNHDVPAARGSGSHSRPLPIPPPAPTNYNTSSGAIRPMIHNLKSSASDQNQGPFTLEMLQGQASAGYGFPGFANSMGSNNYMNQTLQNTENGFSSATKDEPRDDMFFESLLC